MTFDLYRNGEFYRTVEQACERAPFDINVAHVRPFSRSYAAASEPPALEEPMYIERFVRDSGGRYVNQRPQDLPDWLLKLELAEQEQRDRRERFDRFTRMMTPCRNS